jgi:tetratricopeptide (TPR) repeat protein
MNIHPIAQLLIAAAVVIVSTQVSRSQFVRPTFTSSLFECENSYVLLGNPSIDTTFPCVYVYLDRTAGFSMRYVMTARLSATGLLSPVATPLDSGKTSYTVRVQANDGRRVAQLTAEMRNLLALPSEPRWFGVYRLESPVDDAAQRAFHYNQLGMPQKSIEILERQFSKEIKSVDFLFEFGYALNATSQFDRACSVCSLALTVDDGELRVRKEYGFCLMALKRYDEAIPVYERTYLQCDSTAFQREIAAECCMNIAAIKQSQGDKTGHREWIDKAKALVPRSSRLYEPIMKQ